jgi:hypothetical protein
MSACPSVPPHDSSREQMDGHYKIWREYYVSDLYYKLTNFNRLQSVTLEGQTGKLVRLDRQEPQINRMSHKNTRL